MSLKIHLKYAHAIKTENQYGRYIIRRLARKRPPDSRLDEQLNKLRHEDSKSTTWPNHTEVRALSAANKNTFGYFRPVATGLPPSSSIKMIRDWSRMSHVALAPTSRRFISFITTFTRFRSTTRKTLLKVNFSHFNSGFSQQFFGKQNVISIMII